MSVDMYTPAPSMPPAEGRKPSRWIRSAFSFDVPWYIVRTPGCGAAGWQKARRWHLPEEGKLALAETRTIGSGDAQRAYYMHVAVAPPSAIAGDRAHSYALSDMQTALFTQEDQGERAPC